MNGCPLVARNRSPQSCGGGAAGTENSLKPMLEQIKQINQTIATMDKQIDELDKKYSEIAFRPP